MASRQDQLHSHQFMVQRVVSAVVLHETDPVQSPFRRAAGATLAGVLVAALALAAVAVYGVLAPGDGSNWRDPGAVVVERGSGARYVLLDGKLHPVSNYASALLILAGESGAQSTGDGRVRTVTVSRATLATVPRGAPLGITSAPDALPAPDQLLGLPWTLCSAQPAGAGGVAAAVESVLYVGGGPGGGQPLGAGAGLLAQTPDRGLFLFWQGHRYPIPDPAVVRAAFGWGGQQPMRVAAAFANAVPQGPDLAPPAIPGTGKFSRKLPQQRVGTVVVVATQGGSKQYAVVLPDGLAPISQVQADLLLSDPRQVAALGRKRAASISQGDFSLAPAASLPATGTALPQATPVLAQPSATGGVCARVDAAGSPQITVDAALTGAADALRTAGGALADRIVVPPGRGAVVEAAASPGASGGAICVLTDLGVRYPVPTADVLAMLGYGSVQPVRVPAGLVALVPAGRTLDPQAARSPVAPGA
jgi:type VII secretion protein EccB